MGSLLELFGGLVVCITIFFSANTIATDDSKTTMDNVAINGNSGIFGVGEGDADDEEEDEGVGDVDGEDEDELEVASTVPPVTVAGMVSEVPPGA